MKYECDSQIRYLKTFVVDYGSALAKQIEKLIKEDEEKKQNGSSLKD